MRILAKVPARATARVTTLAKVTAGGSQFQFQFHYRISSSLSLTYSLSFSSGRRFSFSFRSIPHFPRCKGAVAPVPVPVVASVLVNVSVSISDPFPVISPDVKAKLVAPTLARVAATTTSHFTTLAKVTDGASSFSFSIVSVCVPVPILV